VIAERHLAAAAAGRHGVVVPLQLRGHDLAFLVLAVVLTVNYGLEWGLLTAVAVLVGETLDDYI
jgi:hypothetical protein